MIYDHSQGLELAPKSPGDRWSRRPHTEAACPRSRWRCYGRICSCRIDTWGSWDMLLDDHMLQPQIIGSHGKAWLADTANGLRITQHSPADNACLAHWVIEAVWAHPVWSSYSLLLMHLRPLPNLPPITFYLPDATHEIWLYAINPKADREHLIATGIPGNAWLNPINFASQIIAPDDDTAKARIHDAVVLICDGFLSPDTDFRPAWMEMFGDNMTIRRSQPWWPEIPHEQKQ